METVLQLQELERPDCLTCVLCFSQAHQDLYIGFSVLFIGLVIVNAQCSTQVAIERTGPIASS